MIAAGMLNKKIKVLERRSQSDNTFGQVEDEYKEVAELNASIKPVKYIKSAILKTVDIIGELEATVRLKEWLTNEYSIVYKDVEYSIQSISHDESDRTTLMLLKAKGKQSE